MESLTEVYQRHPFLTAGILVASLGLLRSTIARARRAPLPPGPRGLPLIGSVLDIPTKEPWRIYSEWSQKYGDVIYFEALGNKLLVLNSLDAINTLLVERSANYSDRIKSPIIELSRHTWGFAFMSYGQEWRDHRRLFHRFFNITDVYQFRPVIEEEVPTFLKHLLSQPADFKSAVHHFFGTIIMRAAYGADDPAYNNALTKDADALLARLLEVMTPGAFLVGFLPSMKWIPSWFPGAGWKRVLEEFAVWNDRFISVPYNDTKARMRNGTQKSEFPSMAVEAIEELPEETDPDFEYKEMVVKNVTASTYIAGSDTTLSSGMAVILALVMHPEVQRKAHQEIDAVVGRGRIPSISDLDDLSYVRAIVKEASRWHSVVPLAMAHLSTEEDVYNGMRIPAGTMVMPNTWQIMHDTRYFKDPFEFKPERYLNADGQFDASAPGHDLDAFGYGRRICPGRHLSDLNLLTMTASLLSCFNIKPAANQKEPLTLKISSNTVSYPLPFECRIEPRSQSHITLIDNL